MDQEERALFAKGVQDAVARSTGAALDTALADLGWGDALAQDERTAVSVLFEAQGRAAASSGALGLVLSRALGEDAAAVVLPPFGGTAPPSRLGGDGSLTVAGLLVAPADRAHLVSDDDEGLAVATVALDDLSCRVIGGLDPTMGTVEVTGSLAEATTRAIPSTAWEDVVAAGQRALAHELVGACAAMLDRAREHALDRIQFDVPIASFQAVRHKLADTYVAVEAARAALDAAWEAGSAFDASVAKAVAGRSARLAAKHCQQVLAGIGFTTEHDLHRYVKRVRVLDGLLGDSRSLTRAIGEQLLRAGGLPPPAQLV
jgi:hypothetical protein